WLSGEGRAEDVSSPLTKKHKTAISQRRHSNGRRLVGKAGEAQVLPLNVPNKHKRLAQDLFNTLVECRWRYTLIVFLLSHFVSWFLFALVWYAMALAHGDMEETVREVGELPCLINVMDFTSAFIFSMESQTTIGYGTAYPSRDCPQAVVAFSVGIVFAKLTRPHLRSQTLLFGRRAVVAVRDGCLTLMFRVGDIRKSELMHRIDDKSPLYRFDPRDVQRDPFELLVFLEGTNQATGQTTQARTSYSQTDILWGHKLYPMFNKKHDRYEADYNRFHETIEVDTPLCSAQDLNRVRRLSELSVLHPITESREETSVDIEA
ncbi:hypothetical protein FOCC_FOCC016371, partial [Frankliniella occidentalis]